MIRTLLVVVVGLLVPGMAAAQYADAPTPGDSPPPPGYYAPPPAGYNPNPGAAPGDYYPSQQASTTPVSLAKLEGLVLSLELGYGPGLGDVIKDSSGNNLTMSDGISGAIPLVLGVGYRVSPLFSFGGLFQYGFLSVKGCPSGASCSGSDMRIGIEGRLHFMADQAFSPWISGGFAYEWFDISMSEAGQSMSATYKGPELDFDAGGDFRVNPGFTIGPFVGLRVGTYDSVSATDSTGLSGSADVPSDQQTTHGWFMFGFRGAFTL